MKSNQGPLSRRALDDALVEAGFRLFVNKHRAWKHPSGVVIFESHTPSDQKALVNARAVIRRTLRRMGCEVTV